MSEPAMYLTDDRDLPEDRLRSLVIFPGGNGDWYVQVSPTSGRTTEVVRISTSSGAQMACPGLGAAIADAYRAMKAAQSGQVNPEPSKAQLLDEVMAWRQAAPTHEYAFGRIVKKEAD